MSGKLSFSEKLVISLISAILFIIINSPILYKFVNSLVIKYGITTASPDGCPTLVGIAIHGAIFFFVVLLIMIV